MNPQGNIADIRTDFGHVSGSLGCTALQPLWFLLVNSAMCTNLFNGFFTLWITQLIASFFLFWSMVRSSSSYVCVCPGLVAVFLTPSACIHICCFR